MLCSPLQLHCDFCALAPRDCDPSVLMKTIAASRNEDIVFRLESVNGVVNGWLGKRSFSELRTKRGLPEIEKTQARGKCGQGVISFTDNTFKGDWETVYEGTDCLLCQRKFIMLRSIEMFDH